MGSELFFMEVFFLFLSVFLFLSLCKGQNYAHFIYICYINIEPLLSCLETVIFVVSSKRKSHSSDDGQYNSYILQVTVK